MGTPTLTRPLKVGNVHTYVDEFNALAPADAPIKATEVDADIDLLVNAWNSPTSAFPPTGPAGGDLGAAGSTYPNPVIAPGAVTAAKIAAGVIPTTLPGPPTGAAGGDLAGSTYPNPVIAPLAVTTGKHADLSVTTPKLAVAATVRGSVNVALPNSYVSGSGGAWVQVATTPPLTTRGGPVLIALVAGGALLTNSTSPVGFYYGLYQDGTILVGWRYTLQSSGTTNFAYMPAPSVTWLVYPPPSAGSHTYGFWVLPPATTQYASPGDSAGYLMATELA